ncbi:MAG: Fe2+-dependent dioxygenase [Acidobacteria bacterium]|nr:Fe2+-dependent dioxygenase [Acidobacteriota bacterium]
MGFEILNVLSPEQVSQIVTELAGCSFADGRMTARTTPRSIKDNLQVDRDSTDTTAIDQIILSSLQRNPLFQNFTLPKRVMAPIYSRYEPGMHYGAHVDNALMGSPNWDSKLRTDYSMTIFLSPPGSYEGGELVVEMELGTEEVKLNPGEAIIYSSSTVHYVAPIKSGVRLAAVTWIQSMVRDERLRAVLYDLIRASKRAESHGDAELQLLLGKSYHNLIRYAAEP